MNCNFRQNNLTILFFFICMQFSRFSGISTPGTEHSSRTYFGVLQNIVGEYFILKQEMFVKH